MSEQPLTVRNANHPDAIAGQYIVVLNQAAQKNLSAQGLGTEELTEQSVITTLGLDPAGLDIQQLYSHALRGFAAQLSAENLERLQGNPLVKYIEQDARVQGNGVQSSPANWGLDRLDQRSLPLNRSYSYVTTGRGVTAFIVDSGINVNHQDFSGRARWGSNFVGDGKNYDCVGHGTHVAGTVGGSNMGVAKGVNLVAVKVLGCDNSGSISSIVGGLDWVAGQNTGGRKVINISINSYSRGTYQAYADAINRLAYANVPVVNSAGNQNDNACYHGPADVTAAIVVGATDANDRRANFSNYGSCVDIFAPGVDIYSADYNNTGGYVYMSGTSMAAPHVAGAVARLLEAQPSLSVAQVEQALINNSTKNVVYDPAGSPNRLLFVDSSDGGTTPTNPTEPTQPTNPTYTQTYNGYLNQGQYAYLHQGGKQMQGTILAALSGDQGTDFDLALQRWNGSNWVKVAESNGSTSEESLSYEARGEYYRLVVYAYSGSGNSVLRTNGM